MKRSTYIIILLLAFSGWLGFDDYRLRGNDPKTLEIYADQIKEAQKKVKELVEICKK